MTTTRRPVGRAGVDTTSMAARLTQAAMAVVLAIISVLLLITTHRVELGLFGVQLPAGLVFGAVFQVVACVFLWSATGSRMPLVVLGSLWGLLATPFLGRGVGGGVLLPAEIAEQPQYSGWIVQILGIGIPFAIAALITLVRISRARAR